MCSSCSIWEWDYVFMKGMLRSDVDAIYYVDWLTTHSVKYIDQTAMAVTL